MLRVWRSPEIRPTMDIDLLGRASNDEASIVTQIREIMTVDVEPDGSALNLLRFRLNGSPKTPIMQGSESAFVGCR